MNEHKLETKPENHITLTVVTVDGNYTDKYNIKNDLQKVVDKTIEKLGLMYDLTQYTLYFAGNKLDLSKTIEESGLKDNDNLEFRRPNAGGGERQ